jgi:hypothetical protein
MDTKDNEMPLSGNFNAKKVNMINSMSDDRLQTSYVLSQLLRGHVKYCYAWLINGVCPQHIVNGVCHFTHEYPSTWTLKQIRSHMKILRMMNWLWSECTSRETFNSIINKEVDIVSMCLKSQCVPCDT